MILASFSSILSTVGYILIAILALMFMVIIHELGHYLAAKALGFKVLEFTVGFGPKIFSVTNKKNGEIFSIRPFPLGGACMFEDEESSSDSPTAFNNQPPWKRLIVLFAGAFFNFVSALIIITLFFTFYGQLLPQVQQIYTDGIVLEEYPLKVGDVIIKIDGKQANFAMQNDLNDQFAKAGDTAEFTVLRNGKEEKITVSKRYYTLLDKDGNPTVDEDGKIIQKYGFGMASSLTPTRFNFFTSFGRSFSFCFHLVYKILELLIMLVTGQLGMESVGGPITVIDSIKTYAQEGFAALSYMVCLISANLAVMNLLPIPALDGSRMVFCIIEWIRKKPINKKTEGLIHTVGLFALFGFAIFADLFQLFT